MPGTDPNGVDHNLYARVAVLEQWKRDHSEASQAVHDKIDKLQQSVDEVHKILRWAALLVFGSAAGGNALSEFISSLVGSGAP